MSFVPIKDFGRLGFVADTPQGATPPHAFGVVRNVSFDGPYISKRLEPEMINPVPPVLDDIIWGEEFFDGTIVRIIAATRTSLWLLSADGASWVDVTRESSPSVKQPYQTPQDGYWQSFPWGNTVVFNNGIDIPQVYNPDTDLFVNMPKWGIVTDSLAQPGYDTNLKARFLVPFKNFIVACNLSWTDPDGDVFLDDVNRAWWSDAYRSPKLWLDPGASSYPWDYNDPATLSGQNLLGMEDGPLQWAAPLGQDLVIYNSSAATLMQLQEDFAVFDFTRLFNFGCVGLYGAVEYQNQHFVVSADTMYIHDTNTVRQVAADRVRDWFFSSVKNLEATVRLVTDISKREVVIAFDAKPDPTLLPVGNPDPTRLALIYNYEDDNFSVIDAMVDPDGVTLVPVVCMAVGLDLQRSTSIGGTWDDAEGVWDDQSQSWNELAGSQTASTIKTSTFWFTASNVYRANSLATTSPLKSYLVQKKNMNLDELLPEATTNFWLHISQMLPHMVGDGSMQVRAGWSPDLETNPVWGPYKDYNLGDAFTPADFKVDFRQTGRYLALEFRFENINTMRLSGADVDLKMVYGR